MVNLEAMKSAACEKYCDMLQRKCVSVEMSDRLAFSTVPPEYKPVVS
jgi:hypothetical protein